MMTKFSKSLLLLLVVVVSTSVSVNAGASFGSCASAGGKASFYCPSKCDGTYMSDCASCDGFMTGDQDHGICIDRRLFRPTNTDPNNHDDHYHFLWNDLVGAVVWFFTAGIAIACGVGGGGIYVPLGILLFRFGPKQSSGFSQACIFGASLAGLILNSRSRHPVRNIRQDPGIPEAGRPMTKQQPLTQAEQDQYVAKGGKFYTRPMVNYDMALFMSAMQTAGAVLGVLVQRVLPNWLYLLIAGTVLSYTSFRTFKKYFASRRVETQKQKRLAAEQAQVAEQQEKPDNQTRNSFDDSSSETAAESKSQGPEQTTNNQGDNEVEQGDASLPSVDKNDIDDDDDEKLQLRKQYLEEDMRQYPMEKIGALVVLWVGLFILTLFQGGKGVESLVGIQCDSPWYYVIIALQFVWLFALAAYYGYKLLRDQRARVAVNYPYLGEEDPVWDLKGVRFYGAFCFFSGLLSAMIGIAGGMVLGPMMLIMGVDPRVSSATNSTMIVVTSSSIAIMFVTSGLVPWSYAVFYFCVTFSGALFGKSKIDRYVKRTGRASLLIFILACIIAFSTIGCFFILISRLVQTNWCFDNFQPFCSVGNEEECPVDQLLGIGSASSASPSSLSSMDIDVPPSEWSP